MNSSAFLGVETTAALTRQAVADEATAKLHDLPEPRDVGAIRRRNPWRRSANSKAGCSNRGRGAERFQGWTNQTNSLRRCGDADCSE